MKRMGLFSGSYFMEAHENMSVLSARAARTIVLTTGLGRNFKGAAVTWMESQERNELQMLNKQCSKTSMKSMHFSIGVRCNSTPHPWVSLACSVM